MKIFRIKNMSNEKINKEIMRVTYIFVILFIVLISYLIYFTGFKSEEIINNSYNSRGSIFAERVIRGKIKSKNGDVLAETLIDQDGNEKRSYPYSNIYAHVIGYCDMGNTGVESIVNFKLLTSNDLLSNQIKNDINGNKNYGDTVYTTLDTDLQEAAYNGLGNNKGAVVVMNVKTGEILAMVSKPDFDPNIIAENYDIYNDDSSTVLLNRATQGLYPPGSTFKIVTALEYIKEKENISGYSYDCTGVFEYGEGSVSCYHKEQHGEVDFAKSFAKSCNTSFANIGSQLNKESFGKTCDSLLFNSKIPIPFSYKESIIDINEQSSESDMIQSCIGQGKTQITPIHMLMLTSAIANDGNLAEPMIISKIINKKGSVVKKYETKVMKNFIDSKNANVLRNLMYEVVENGTGSALKDSALYTAAGKTGSAEYCDDKTKSHAWFTGFAPFDNPEIAVTVIVEEGGSGGKVAAPIARMIFDTYFSK